MGGRGGWIFNHTLTVGGGIYGMLTEVDAPEDAPTAFGPLDVEFAYLGPEVEYAFHRGSRGQIAAYSLIGMGFTKYVKDKSSRQIGESFSMFVLEPGVSGELTVTRWFHAGAGLSYRFVTGLTHDELESGDFAGLTGTLTFKLGWF